MSNSSRHGLGVEIHEQDFRTESSQYTEIDVVAVSGSKQADPICLSRRQ